MTENETDDQLLPRTLITDAEDLHLLPEEAEVGDEVHPAHRIEMLDHRHLEDVREVTPEAEADRHLEDGLVALDDLVLPIDKVI